MSLDVTSLPQHCCNGSGFALRMKDVLRPMPGSRSHARPQIGMINELAAGMGQGL
jgi:hypothetical protein